MTAPRGTLSRMKIVFRWEDRDQAAAPPATDIYWTRDMEPADLEYPDPPAVYRHGRQPLSDDELNEALREQIERGLQLGIASGFEQVIEMPHLDSGLTYMGTVAWELVGENRKEKVWIATKFTPSFVVGDPRGQSASSNPGARLRLSNQSQVEEFDASDLASFTKAYREAWKRWRARLGPWPALVLHVRHRGTWWIVTDPGNANTVLTVADAKPKDIARYWNGVLEALAFFAKADAPRAHNPAFDMTLNDAYRELGLEPGASKEQVTAAYRKLSKQNHPDRGGDLVKMQRLNVARDLIESGGRGAASSSSRSSGSPQQHDEASARQDFWWRAQPSGHYTVQDLRRVADWVLSMGLKAVLYRERVDHVPVDARVGKNTYTRPFGSVARRDKIPDSIDADVLASAFERYHPGDPLFDIGMSKDVAWITWRVRPHGYQSVSFERPVKRKPKPKDVGLTPSAAADIMRELGLRDVAGGTKYGYWAVPMPGRTEKTGIFVRTSKRTLRLVKRVRKATGIEDDPLDNEVYYGELTRAQLEQWAKMIRDRAGVVG